MMTSWLAEYGVQIIIGLFGAGTLVGIVTAILNHFAHIQINRETAVARRNQTADTTVASALDTLGHTIQELRDENVDLRRRMSEMEAARLLEHEARKREKAEWQRQMTELRESLSTAQEGIAERDKEIKALTETVTKLQIELTQAKRGTGLNYTQRRKQ